MAIQRPESEARIAAMFDRVAPRYDLLNRLLSARQDQRWRRRLVSMVPYRPEGRYLDVATGTGDVLLAVAKARREYGAYLGVDISREMLGLAEAKARTALATGDAAERPAGSVAFQCMSAERLTVPDQSIDCLSISFGLRNVVNKARALQEFHRVLAPGGTLLILEFFIPRTGLLSWVFQLYFHHVLPFIGGLLSDRDAYRYLPQSVGSFYTAEELRHALYHQGFKVDEMVNYLFGSCRLVRASKL